MGLAVGSGPSRGSSAPFPGASLCPPPPPFLGALMGLRCLQASFATQLPGFSTEITYYRGREHSDIEVCRVVLIKGHRGGQAEFHRALRPDEARPAGGDRREGRPGRPGLWGKHLGLRKYSPDKPNFRFMEKNVGGLLNPRPRPTPQETSCPGVGTHVGAGLSAVMPTSPLDAGLFLGRKCQGRRLPSALCQGGWKDGLGLGGEVRGRGIFRLLPSGELLSLIPSDLFLRFTKSLPFPGSLWGLGRPQWPLSFRNFLWHSSPCCFLAVG